MPDVTDSETARSMRVQPPGGSVPVPDPTTLTTDIVNQAKADLRRETMSLRELIETRLDGLDAIVGLVGQQVRDAPTERAADISVAVGTLQSVTNERFKAIQQQFAEVREQFALVESLRVEQKIDTKSAVDAAFAAAEKAQTAVTAAGDRAIAKSESSTKEQLTALAETFTTAIAGITRSLDDQKDRLNSLELRLTSRLDTTGGVATGQAELRVTNRENTSLYVATAVGVLLFISTVATIIAFVIHG